MKVINSPVLPVILEQHAEEAAILWLLRNRAVTAPHYTLAELAQLDERVESHLDGLRLAGDAGWEICRKGVEEGWAGEVFAAAVLATESGNSIRIAEIVDAGTASPATGRGLISALGWLPLGYAEAHIAPLLTAQSPAARRVGIAAMSVHRRIPRQALAGALADGDPLVKARALRAVGELGLVELVPAARKSLADEDEDCRFWAAWSVARLGDNPQAIAALQAFAESGGPYCERALSIALRCLEQAAATAWQRQLVQQPEQLRTPVIAAGVLGDSGSVPWLIEQMASPRLARIAGESFAMITGVNVACPDLEGERPGGFEAGPTEDPDDENVEMDPDEHLPWPDPFRIAAWWRTHRHRFEPGTRYLVGKPMTMEWLNEVLGNGYQRQRAAAALELAIRQPGQPLFEVRAPGFRQQEWLGLKQRGV